MKSAGFVVVLATLASGVARAQQSFERVNVSPTGAPGTHGSQDPAISADGRFVAFVSRSSNLVAGDTNDRYDVFVRDLEQGITRLASSSTSGGPADGHSGESLAGGYSLKRIDLSADGRFVVFASGATNLVPGDTNGMTDVFLRDMQSSTCERISAQPDGTQSTTGSYWPSISADGNRIVYWATSPDVAPGVPSHEERPFLRDRVLGTVRALDIAPDGVTRYDTVWGVMSNDGREFVFETEPISGPAWFYDQLLSLDLDTGSVAPVVPGTGPYGATTRFRAQPIAISADRRWIVLSSWTDLDPDDGVDTAYQDNMWLLDRTTHECERVTIPNEPALPWSTYSEIAWQASVAPDGASVLFLMAQDFMTGEGLSELLEYERATNSNCFASRGDGGVPACPIPASNSFDATPDHSAVAFSSFGVEHAGLPQYAWDVSNVFVMRRRGESATSTCSSEAAAANCPCGNQGQAGRGCANSFDPRGALLLARGNPRLSEDTLQFYGQSVFGPALLLSSTSLLGGSAGVPFAQGLACLSSPLLLARGLHDLPYGLVEVGATGHGGPPISTMSGVTAPGTRYYQLWYRNAVIPGCSASAGNFTNAVRVEWRL